MDKTYNDLLSIVNRTKQYDTEKKKVTKPRIPVAEDYEEEYEPLEYDIVDKPKSKKKSSSSTLNDLVEKTTKKSTTKKSTTKSTAKKSTTKKATTKSTAKKSTSTSTTKKDTAKKTVADNKNKLAELVSKSTSTTKSSPKTNKTTAPEVDVNSPLYQALKDSLFSGGTDISEYINDSEMDLSDTQNSLQELRAKKEAQKINSEITKEQQEYEQLFTGSLGSFYGENEEENIEEINDKTANTIEKNAKLAGDLNKILTNLENKKNPTSSSNLSSRNFVELDSGNKDLDRKIAEYYKRKQEKIEKYNAEEKEGLVEEQKPQENNEVDYEAIFGGPMTTRDELMGIEKHETSSMPTDEENNEDDNVTSSQPETSADTLPQTEEVTEEVTEEATEEVTEEESSLSDDIEDSNISQEQPDNTAEEIFSETTEENIDEEEKEKLIENENVIDNSNNDIPDEDNSAESSSSDNKKDSHIKSLLNDLLFSKKEHAEEINSSKEKIDDTDNNHQVTDNNESDNNQDNYASVWEQSLSEDKSISSEEVEGEGFTMKDSQPQPQEVVEYADRAIVEVDNNTSIIDNNLEEDKLSNDALEIDTNDNITEGEKVDNEVIELSQPSISDDNSNTPSDSEVDSHQENIEDSEEDYEDFIVIRPKNIEDNINTQPSDNIDDAKDSTLQESSQEDNSNNSQTEIVDEINNDIELATESDEKLPVEKELDLEEDYLVIKPKVEDDIVSDNNTYQEYINSEDNEVDNIEEKEETSHNEELITSDVSVDNDIANNDEIEIAQETNSQETSQEDNLEDNLESTSDNLYNLSDNDNTIDDYIISGNSFEHTIIKEDNEEHSQSTEVNEDKVIDNQSSIEDTITQVEDNVTQVEDNITPTEENAEDNTSVISQVEEVQEEDTHFESVVNNERAYEQTTTQPEVNYQPTSSDDDNTLVMNTLPENKIDLFGNEIVEEDNVADEEVNNNISDKEDTISKEEFYNEMARLQENLINELKGNKVESESVDFFAEQPQVDESQAQSVVEELIESIQSQQLEEEQDNAEEAVSDIPAQDTESAEQDNEEQSIVGINAEPVDPENFDDYNLLNKDVALSEKDLEPEQEESEEVKETPKDTYFYLSPEDNAKKASFADEYMTIYEEPNTPSKDLGDINIFKNIGNAIPSSEILKEKEEPSIKEVSDDEIETIYTLMGIQTRTIAKEEKDIKVLYVTSECQPFIASGGLADVAGSLPKAISNAENSNIDIRVIMPLYGTIKNEYKDKFEYLGNFTVHLSWRQEYCGLFRYFQDGVTYYFIDNERYFKRDKLYGYYDDGERFAYFSKAIVEALPHLNFFPDIIHCNDWQSALVSAYIKTGNWSDFRYYRIKHIFTIHNVEYQGVYGMENLKDLFGIDPRFRNDLEYNGDINLCKTAIQYCDKFTTVSNSYCDNLKQPYCSRGLHHIIIRNEYKLSGIINGIDYDFYNPATDTQLFKNYDIACIEEKVLNKKLWQDEIGLPVDGDTPMIAIVSRLVGHKGVDLITKIIHNTLQQDIQLVVVGTGDQKYTDFFKNLEEKYPTKVRVFVDKYSNEIARKAYGASDIFLMPSKIEPCGLSQMIASRYGSVPIVREVGGLKDTITDFGCEGGGNGYTFTNYNPNDLQYQLDRAIRDFSNRTEWKEKMKICMSQDFTWNNPAIKYIDLYKSISNN